MDKVVFSDHCPNSTSCTINPVCSLDFITQCLDGALNNNHCDMNRRGVAPLQVSKNVWISAVVELERQSHLLNDRIQNENISNDHLQSLTSSTIYDACKRNYKVQTPEVI